MDDDFNATSLKQGRSANNYEDAFGILPEKASERLTESTVNARASSSENAVSRASSSSNDFTAAPANTKSNSIPKKMWGFWSSKKVFILILILIFILLKYIKC